MGGTVIVVSHRSGLLAFLLRDADSGTCHSSTCEVDVTGPGLQIMLTSTSLKWVESQPDENGFGGGGGAQWVEVS